MITKEKIEKKEVKKSKLRRIFCRRNRILVLSGICGILLGFCIVPGGIQYLRNFCYSFLPTDATIIQLPADPYENGIKHGRECRSSINLLCDLYLKKMVCRNSNKILKKKSLKAEAIFSKIDQRWTEEIKGLSKGCGVDKSVLMLANTFLDIGLARLGCRQVVLEAGGGDPDKPRRLLHAHNLDWNNLGGIGNFLVTVFRKAGDKDRFATVRMGFPGLIGALTIINEKGISLGFDQIGFSKKASKMPIFIAMRDIAETCSTFEEAEKKLINMPQGMPFCIMMADAKTGQAAVFERLRGQISTLHSDKKSENISVTPVFKRNIINGVLTADNATWCVKDMSNCNVDKLARKFAKEGCNPEVMKTILRNKKVLLGCNIYSVIFDYANNAFYLAAGEIPAANGKYIKYTLFKK